ELPVKYLGVPLISSRLLIRDCKNKVADLIVNWVWAWPQVWLHKAPDIGTIAAPVLDVLQTDVTQWRDHNGTLSSFSVAKAWEAIRPRAKVWSYVRVLADMDLVPPVMHDIILHLQPMGSKRTARCIFGKLIVAAAAYFIWLERNNRTFKNVRRSPEEIRDIIMVTVRLKLLSLRFKNTDSVRHLLSRYKRRCCSLIPAESDSLPYAHAQTTKTYYKHQDSRIKKAQELKTFTNSDIQDLPLRYQDYQGRLLASFQDDAKYEHVGQDTRLQDGKDDKDIQGKDLKISKLRTKSKDND
ncbi:hypothetical protein Tco_0720912, partial [Tanacetum coccineum]